MKVCATCCLSKELDLFHNDKRTPTGKVPSCKECIKQRGILYRKNKSSSIKAYQKKHYAENRDKILKKASLYRKDNQDRISDYLKEYQKQNKTKIKEYLKAYSKQHRELNRDKYRAKDAKRRAAELRALPRWLMAEHLQEILDFYTAASMFRIYTGLEYHVDHIVPLQGKTVCGLHVPWNLQVLESSDNIRKSNKFEEV